MYEASLVQVDSLDTVWRIAFPGVSSSQRLLLLAASGLHSAMHADHSDSGMARRIQSIHSSRCRCNAWAGLLRDGAKVHP